MDSVFFLNFLTICFIAECRSATVKRIGEGTWEGKKYDSVSNIQASTRVLTKYKPEMVSIFYYLPKSRKVRFKWMQKQKFLVFFFCSPVVVVAEPVVDPDLELSGRGGEVFLFCLHHWLLHSRAAAAICFVTQNKGGRGWARVPPLDVQM